MRIILFLFVYSVLIGALPRQAFGQQEDARFQIKLLRLNTKRDEAFPVFYGNRLYYFSAAKLKFPLHLTASNAYYCMLPHADSSYASRERVFIAQKREQQGMLAGASYAASANAIFYSRYLAKSVGKSSAQLYRALVSDNVWYSAVPVLQNLPDTVLACYPSVSADGNTLYFSANLSGGYGGFDIYLVQKDSSGRWGKPVNLGTVINSPYDEITPFIHPEGNLYFASNRIDGYGGFDIYEAPSVAGKFQECRLMPVPLNSPDNDFALIMNEAQRLGYFTSDRRGNYDIYAVEVIQLHRTRNLSEYGEGMYEQFEMEVSGSVIDTANRQPVRGALVKLRDVYTDDIRITFTDNEGKYRFTIQNDHKYQIGVSKVGYQSIDDIEFSTIGITEPIPLSINLLMSLPLYRQSLKVYVREAVAKQQAAKEPIADALLVLEDVASGEKYEKRSEPDGTCLFIIEQGRTYKLFAEAEGYQKSLPYRITTNPKYMGHVIEMTVELPREEVIDNMSSRYIRAIVVNQENNHPLENATVYLTNTKTGETRFLYTSKDGTATFKVDSGLVYKLEAQILGYQMEDYMIAEGNDVEIGRSYEVLLPLKPVDYNPIPLDVTIPAVYYTSDREILSESVKGELNRVLQLLAEYPGVKIAIESHAGLHESRNVYEIALKRANAAAAYLFRNGLRRERVVAIRSFGAERQQYNCLRKECTPEQRRANRRTEFIIVYR
ncbi:MAG: carboxypeptidase regulatory-like domain-containing protein [Cytophagales bacterium]|nr:carboxypeptidase regulatory-like domain-containing protein [Bernardetiaceae bacterium]MDW8204818.1 carboxypeptidase regulatory-like domain-containing protein [Cytophagales bacterium]